MRKGARDADTLVFSSVSGRADPASRPGVATRAQPSGAGVRIWLERKGRNGGPVSIVRGLTLDRAHLAALASDIKRTCGTGGSAKDGEIIIQGDHRARIAELLTERGIASKLAGG